LKKALGDFMKGLDFGSASAPVEDSASEEEVSEGESEEESDEEDSDEDGEASEDEEDESDSEDEESEEEEEERPTVVEKVERAKKVEKAAPAKVEAKTQAEPQADPNATSGKVRSAFSLTDRRLSLPLHHGRHCSLLYPLPRRRSNLWHHSSLPDCATKRLRCWKI